MRAKSLVFCTTHDVLCGAPDRLWIRLLGQIHSRRDNASGMEAPHPSMEEDFAYPVGKFSKFVVKYPVVVMFASFFVSVALSASLMASDSVKLLGAWSDDSSPIVRGLKGFARARLEWYIYLDYEYDYYEVRDEPEEGTRRLTHSDDRAYPSLSRKHPRVPPHLASLTCVPWGQIA